MRSSGQQQTDIENLRTSYSAMFTRMRNATVRLSGGTFTGTGVLLTATNSGGNTYLAVATAAHNLTIYIDGLSGNVKHPFWEDRLADVEGSSDTRLELLNDKKAAIINQVTKGTISPFSMEFAGLPARQVRKVILGDWTRDVCLLLARDVTDPSANYTTSAIYQRRQDLAHWDEVSTQLNINNTLPNGYRLVQAGFGQTSLENENSKQFNFKVSQLAQVQGAWAQDYYDSRLGTNSEVILLRSRHDWTTLPGDSGGPLFAIHPGGQKIAVLGVTLGADLFATEDAENQAAALDERDGAHNNACTSLASLYYAWPYGSTAQFSTALFAPTFDF